MTRATLLVIAPPAPVAWSPGTPPLSDSLRARVLAGAGSIAERAVAVLPASGRRVVGLPVGATLRPASVHDRPRRPVGERVAIPVAAVPSAASVDTPWATAEAVPGVAVRTSRVPAEWLRPFVPPSQRPVGALARLPRPTPEPGLAAARPRPARQPERALPASVRLRRAAVMAFGLLVSLVAVEAAARVGRR